MLQISQAISVPISEDDYFSEISIFYGKAASPYGVTVSMIKAWPEDVHLQVI